MKATVAGLAIVLAVAVVEPAPAQVQKFPYEASISGDDVYVRSGPGKKYYPTGKLKTGERVTVHRHDPGGWYMVAPPTGSYSLVRADALKSLGNRRALVTGNQVPVLVGSTLGDSRDIEQVRLSTNDQIQLLDEQAVAGAGGVAYYRVVPPRGEYRWVLGQFVTPLDATLRSQNDRDPFATPSIAKPAPSTEQASKPVPATPEVDGSAAGFDSPGEKTASAIPTPTDGSVRRNAPEVEALLAERQHLAELDRKFREMIQADVSAWNLDPFEQTYRELKQEATSPAVSNQIDLRLQAVGRYRAIKNEYDDFLRLTTETTRRDEELAARQGGTPVGSVAATPSPSTTVTARPPSGDSPTPATQQERIASNPTNTVIDSPRLPVQPPASPVPSTETAVPPAATLSEPTFQDVFPSPAIPTTPTPSPVEQPINSVPAPTAEQPLSRVTAPTNAAPQPGLPRATLPRTANSNPVPRSFAPPSGSSVQPPVPSPTSAAVSTPGSTTPAPVFVGAGVVQRAKPFAPGAPEHVLMTPQGRVLALLKSASGVNLDQYVGQAVGVQGDRTRRPDLRIELIDVQALTPVRLSSR